MKAIDKSIIGGGSIKIARSSLVEPIMNYVTMDTGGALLITGEWGSGKTYHLKNHILPYLEKEAKRIPILISLYGEKDKSNIVQKILFAYFDKKGEDVKLSSAIISKNLKRIAGALPIVKKYVDVDKLLFGTGENALALVPHEKLLICFDDLERMSKKIKLDDFLGLVNELVENRRCKVVLIANELMIGGTLNFKEKTIDKTIYFNPNIEGIFDSLLTAKDPSRYKGFLMKNKAFFVESLTTPTEDEDMREELRKSLANVRTLKFALEHFRVVFELLDDGQLLELKTKQLKNLWIFVLSISVEFRKSGGITRTLKKGLDTQFSTLADIDIASIKQIFSPEERGGETTPDNGFLKLFIKTYYSRLSLPYIFFEDLYMFITSGKKIQKDTFIDVVDEHFRVKDGVINPAHEALDKLMNGYWKLSNQQFVETAGKLLAHSEKGELEDAVSYLNAAKLLIGFSGIVGIDKKVISGKFKTGLEIFLPRMMVNALDRAKFEMVADHFEGAELSELLAQIKEGIDKSEKAQIDFKVIDLQSLFESDISAFVKQLLPSNNGIRTPDRPILHLLSSESIRKGIVSSNGEGILDLSSLLKIRYLDSGFGQSLQDETAFLDEVQNSISSIDLNEKTLSNFIVETHLVPSLTKVRKMFDGQREQDNKLSRKRKETDD